MKKYALVEDNTVTRFVSKLPTVWKNISGLHLASPVELQVLGWFPVVTTDEHSNQIHTETVPANNEVRDIDQVIIEEERVVVVQRVRAKNKEEIDKDWVALRIERDRRLHDTDWWGVSDRTMTVEQAQYRADLRNFPAVVDIADWPNVTWPTEIGT